MTQRPERASLETQLIFSPISPVPIKRYKSFFQLITMSFILSISALIFGYSLTEISTIPMTDLQGPFKINFSLSTAQGLLTGAMPIGGILGGFANGLFLKLFSRRTSHFVVAIICVIGTILTEITYLETLFAGRFVIGIACGVYTAIAPVYIKEISPKQKKSQLGSFFIVGKISGVVLSYAMGLLFYELNILNYWRYIFMMPGLLSIIQVILIVLFIPHSPAEMVQKEKLENAREVITRIYEEKFVEEVLQEMILDYKAEIVKTMAMEGLDQVVGQSKSFRKNRRRALAMGIHVAVLRQFIGVNCLVTYSQNIVQPYNANAATFTPITINIVQLIGTICALIWFTTIFARRPLFNFGVGGLTIIALGMALTMMFSQIIPVLVLMNMFMFLNGATLGAAGWAYPAEIIPPSKQPIVTFFSWVAIAVITIFPPMIINAMPDQNAYPLFFFFTFWGAWSFVYDWFCLVQTKGRSYQSIIAEF